MGFVEKVNQTAFSRAWDGFDKVRRTSGRSPFDDSLLSTARAVLLDKVQAGETVAIEEYSVSSPSWFRDYDSLRDEVMPSSKEDIRIIALDTYAENFDTVYNRVKERLSGDGEDEDGWELAPRVTEFFSGKMQVFCLINERLRSSLTLMNGHSLSKWHTMQSAFLAFCPWYLDKEHGLSKNEKRLFDSLKNGNTEEYLEVLSAIYAEHDYETQYLRETLRGFNNIGLETRLRSAEVDIESYEHEVADLNERICDYVSRIRELNARILGYRDTIAQTENENEVLEFFIHNKAAVEIMDSSRDDGGTVRFFAFGSLEYWDEDEAESYISNHNSYIYQNIPHGRYVSKRDMEPLMRSIFVDRILSVSIIACYKLSGNGCVSGISGASYPARFATYLPNPHIDRYQCLGSYLRVMREAVLSGDFVTAIEQAIASSRSLNFGDSTVMSQFMQKMYESTQEFIKLPDGTFTNTAGAVAYLRQSGYIKEEENEDGTDD